MKKKLIIILLFMCIFLTGCSNLKEMSLDEIIKVGTDRKISVYNKYRKGYKYNLPKGLDVVDGLEYNEIIASKDYKYYLYIDAVSYYNKIIEKYEVSEQAFVSKPISFEDKYGYLEVNELSNGKYFIEIMYNYAKIEVIVNSADVNLVVSNCLSVLASISFNDNVLKSLLDEETSQFREFEFNIFETVSTNDSDFLETIEKEELPEEEEIHDGDLIN